MDHGHWTPLRSYLYVVINVIIAIAYFAFGPVLKHLLDAGKRELISQSDLTTWFASFVWWCGVHHLTMGPLMISNGPLQWWILMTVDCIVAWVSWTATLKMLRKTYE